MSTEESLMVPVLDKLEAQGEEILSGHKDIVLVNEEVNQIWDLPVNDLSRAKRAVIIRHLRNNRMLFNTVKTARKAKKANFYFYGAPHAVYLFQEKSLSQWSLFDLGLFAQNLMLAAHAKGVGTVPQAFVTDYAREIKEFLGIPASKRLVLGLSLGYPDPAAPINQFRTDRSSVEDFVRWLE